MTSHSLKNLLWCFCEALGLMVGQEVLYLCGQHGVEKFIQWSEYVLHNSLSRKHCLRRHSELQLSNRSSWLFLLVRQNGLTLTNQVLCFWGNPLSMSHIVHLQWNNRRACILYFWRPSLNLRKNLKRIDE